MADLVFSSVLDVMEGAPYESPVNLSWLFDLFESALDEQPNKFQVHRYGPLSRSWKRALSETIANATSIGIAMFEEGFDWAIPVPLAKKADELPDWWPWRSYIFSARPKPVASSSTPFPLMPDFLLGATIGGITSFSSMEVKGRDHPLDTSKFASYPDFKRQSENILLQSHAGTIVPLHRHILSVVAVRPTLATAANRELKCRWFNHAETPDQGPPGLVSQVAAIQFAFLVWRLFGAWLRLPLQLRSGRAPIARLVMPLQLPEQLRLKPVENGFILPRTEKDRSLWRPFISEDALKLLDNLYVPLTRLNGQRERLIAMDSLVTRFLDRQEINNRDHGPMLRIGIGLKFSP